MRFSKNLKKLDGDASSRIFYRLKRKKTSSIIVYSNKDKKSLTPPNKIKTCSRVHYIFAKAIKAKQNF